MIELKFRVWNGMEMVYDVTVGKFGVFYVNPENNGIDSNDSASMTPNTTKYEEGTPVMQFTGLKDKFGNEIYESDIIKGEHGEIDSGIVCFGKGTYDSGYYEYQGFFIDRPSVVYRGDKYISNKTQRDNDATGSFLFDCEIIGNIYENNNLLKKR